MINTSSVTRLGNYLKPLATINLPNSPTFLGNFCKGVKIYHCSSEIIFGQHSQIFGYFFQVTLNTSHFAWTLLDTVRKHFDAIPIKNTNGPSTMFSFCENTNLWSIL